MKLNYLIFLIAALTFSCSSSKKLAEQEAEKPMWLKDKPILEEYYIGIGSARKIGTIDEYTNEARKNALADIAGEISTSISSISVLNQVEDKRGVSEIFQNTIKTSSKDFLTAYEKVESYENETYYWIYYRLSKEKYEIEKAKRKAEAIENALLKYKNALESTQNNKYDFAINQYIRALEILIEYLGEDTPVNFENNQIDLLNEINKNLAAIFREIHITHKKSSLEVKRGMALDKDDLRFNILNKNEEAISGIPVKFSYSGGYLLSEIDISNESGLVSSSINKIKSTGNTEIFRVEIDMQAIANQGTKELLIRKLITNYKANKLQIKINIEQPTIYVINFEENDAKTPKLDIYHTLVNNSLSEKKFKYDAVPQNADYVIYLDASTKKLAKTNGMFKVSLHVKIELQDKNKTSLFSGELNKEVTSLGSYSKAIEEAYTQNKSEFKRKLLDPIIKFLEN